jgi:hypothetical protein
MSARFCALPFVSIWVAATCFNCPLAAQEDSQQPTAVASPSINEAEVESISSPPRPAHLIAMRISAGMLAARLNRDVDGQRAVSDVVLGTPITGTARLVGKLRMHPVPSPDRACFNAVFDGAIYCRTVGRKEGVTVHSHSITQFTASKEIVFEPGKGFYALPTKIGASTQCFTDGINPGRGGLIGRIVERRAAEQVAADRPQVAATIRQKAVERINARFNEFMGEELAQLNKAVELQTRLAQLRTRVGSRKLIARTTPAFIEITDAVLQGNGPAPPLNLPVLTRSDFPIEIWIRSSLVPEKIEEALTKISSSPGESAVVKALEAWPGPLAQEAAAAIRGLITENKVAVQEVGEWMVVEISAPAAKNAVATITAPPATRR